MTTRQRIDVLARAYPRLFPRAELLGLMREQLGDIDALEKWIPRDAIRIRARAPKTILHICAGNLAVSACTSIAHGLILGSHNIVKLPGDRDGSSVRQEILSFIDGLPSPLRKLVETRRDLGDGLRRADGVIAFGTGETMASLRKEIRADQKFIAHGPAVSLLYISDPAHLSPKQASACATDVLTYDQLGCLSPQAIYVPRGTDIAALAAKLAPALERHWRALAKKPARPLGVAARISEARDVAFALGQHVWLPPKRHLGWTLIHDRKSAFEPSPLHGVVTIRIASERQLPAALEKVAGKISTVGVAGQISSRLESVFLSLGVSRFCPAGRMQFPPLTWHHDGGKPLADLVTWVDSEPA